MSKLPPKAHLEIQHILDRCKFHRYEIAAKLGISRKSLNDREYQKVIVRDHMIEAIAVAAEFPLEKIPENVRTNAAAEGARRIKQRRTKREPPAEPAKDATQPTASNPGAPTAPKATNSKPVKVRPPNPVQEAKKTMLRYEVRFIPSHGDIVNGRDARRADGWYTLLPIGNLEHMDYSKAKEEAIAKAAARRVQDNADIAEFL